MRAEPDSFTVGKTARTAGVNVETLRYYERRGLLPNPRRTGANYRIYSQDTVRRIQFIKRAQELGFSLREIKELLSLRARQGARCQDVLNRARAKTKDIDDKIMTLKAMRRSLSKLMSECTGKAPVSDCPILNALDKTKQKGGDREI